MTMTAASAAPVIDALDLTKTYTIGENVVRALQGATLKIYPGDLLAIMSAGAYGAVMASTYNSRPLIPEVLVDGARWHVIRARPSIAQLIALDSVPDWL